jgi:NAD(P)-dependent dehydrogenase (short-subunit alcohol dehydrogenase family)
MNLAGRVVLVTGVTGKVGRGIAHAFATNGASVVGTGRRRERGTAFERDVRDEGHELTYVEADVSNVADSQKAVGIAVERYGRLDVLVNNAATQGDPPIRASHEATEEWWDLILDTNLKGAFFACKHALAPMLEQGSGAIVNIASIMGMNIGGPAGMAAYTASKAGLIALTKTLAVEYFDRGVRMNAVVLGAAEGDNLYQMQDAQARAKFGDAYEPVPYDERNFGRMTGTELADTVMFLAGDESRHINGAALVVDQGISAGLLYARPGLLSGRSPS